MTYETAFAALEAARHTGKLENLRQIIEAYDREAGISNLWESSRLLLHACDVINSHDFGDHRGQTDLIRGYAQRALQQTHYASLEQELRLLAHLQHDFEDGNESWPRKRLARSRRWLRALRLLAEATQEAAVDALPQLKVVPPEQGLPSGIAPEHVANSAARNLYRSTIDRNREDAEAFALRWRMKQLRRAYEPLAVKYISMAYAREPHDLQELKQLLNTHLDAEPETIREPAPRAAISSPEPHPGKPGVPRRRSPTRAKKRKT